MHIIHTTREEGDEEEAVIPGGQRSRSQNQVTWRTEKQEWERGPQSESLTEKRGPGGEEEE